jgi:hypothetical protein
MIAVDLGHDLARPASRPTHRRVSLVSRPERLADDARDRDTGLPELGGQPRVIRSEADVEELHGSSVKTPRLYVNRGTPASSTPAFHEESGSGTKA